MILCAGFGTRLRPLTDELPKPLVPVGDRPLLVHIADRLVNAGVGELVLNVHHRPGKFSKVINGLRVKAHVIHEAEIRGTAGGIAGARDLLGLRPALVVNGDILCDAPFPELLARVGDGLCMAVRPRPRGEGSVGVDRNGAVVRLRGQIFGEEHRGSDYVGAAALGARCLATLPELGCLVGDWALPELARGGRIDTVDSDGEWLDIGSLETYRDANRRWLRRALEEGAPGTLKAQSSFVGAGSRVSPEVTLEGSIVGAGAEVKGYGALVRTVIWPGAVAHAPLEDAIVTTGGQVVR
jgi:mannose-1-phosphate guanylyltransferase